MKKTVKLISIALMSIMMLSCFFFANVFFARAQAPTTLRAIEGASVLVGGGDKDSGIKFELTISKEDYTNLVNANLGKEIWLGVVIGRAGMGELTEENCLQPGGVIDVKKTNTLKSKDADTLYFDFALTYNEDAIYGDLLEDGKISDEADANWKNFLNFMYSDELLVRPFYKVVDDDSYQIGYGQAGVARSMIHVANAETESGITPQGFLEKYAVSKTAAGEEVEVVVGLNGTIVGDVNENIINYTAGTSAEIISRDCNQITDEEFLSTLEHGETFRLFGFTANREIHVYNATVNITIGAPVETLDTLVYLSKTKSPIRFAETTNFTNKAFAADSAKVYFEKDGEIVSFQPSWAEYNGEEVIADGKIDSSLIDVADGEAFELRFYANGKIYNATNVKMYDGIFVNTPESRLAFVDLLSAKAVNAHGGDENWFGEVVEGAYLILEDIYFETNELITNRGGTLGSGVKTYTTFSATLDGLGHTLHNVTLDPSDVNGTMFGYVGANAVIKNLAINDTRFGETNITNRGRLFAAAEAENSLTLENFYFYSKFDAYATYWAGIIWDAAGLKMITRNVVIDLEFQGAVDGYRGAFNYMGAVDASSQAENTYLISSEKTTSSGSANLPADFKIYASKEAMIAANNDYSTFDSAMWGIGQDGLPVFRGLFITALATNENGDEVKELNAVGQYTVSVVDGDNNPLPTQLEVDSANVTISGTTVTVGEGYYTATLTVKDGEGKVVRTYAINIDTREAEEKSEEIIVTKKGAIIVKGTFLQDAEITSVKHNGNEIYTSGTAESNFADGGAINTADFVYGEDGISLSDRLIVETTSGLYALTNVKVYADAYENTKTSREGMVSEFSNNATAKAREAGHYILLESLVFDTTNAKEVFANSNTNYRVFNDTLDGRGYAMTEIMILNTAYSSIFGDWGANAVIKNIAFNNFYFSTVSGDSVSLARQATRGLLFCDNEAEESLLTLDNVYMYVEYEVRENYSSTIAWGSATSVINMNNVFIHVVDNVADNDIGDYHKTIYIQGTTTATNAYLVNPGPRDTTTGFTGKYATIDEMKTASPDLTAFEDSDMWAVVDGIPVFKCFVVTALATNAEGEAVTELNAVGQYTVSVVDGYNNPLTTQLEVDNANVTISGTTVTVGEGYYTATLTVKDGEGKVIRTYPISVDTRVPEENNEEIIATKKGAIIVKGTKLEGLEISSVKYNGNEIYTPGETVTNFADGGAINTANFVYGEDGISLTGNLVVTTNTKIYELTNVIVYADAYENTTASRERMALEFSNNATAKAREAGYYILLENLVFDTTNPLEVFANTEADCRVFNDTFDGRGYAMTNTMIANTSYSIFGDWGENAVIKNVAFNNFYLAKLYGTSSITTLTRQATRGLLFYDAETTESVLTLDNVYVYVEYEIGASYSSTIAFGSATNGSITSNNLFIHIVDKTTNGTIGVGTYHSTVYTATVARTATNSYVVNPAEKDNGPLGTLYKSVDAMKTASPDLTAFEDSDMWAVVDGLPVFKCFVITALATNAQGEEVTEITETGVYTVSVVDGNNTPKATQLEVDSANVTIDGTTVTVGEGYYTATLTVKDGEGKVIRTYTISVDTRVPEENNEEIIATKKGAIIVKGTKLEGSEISSVNYNGNEIYTPGETVTNFADSGSINVANFVYGEDGISLTGNLVVTTNTKIYELTNVNVYADAYENTTASRERMVLEFSNNATAKAREAGYYILLENLEFDTTNPLEVFANTAADCRVFSDTLDGRGYAMTNTMVANTSISIFGDWGENAVVKNVAFNNFYHATISGSSITALTRDISRGWLFYDNETDTSELTLDNVYLYVEYNIQGDNYGSTLLWGSATSIVRMNNVFVHVVNNVEGGNIGTYAKTIYMDIQATSTNAYEVTTTKASSGITYFASIDAMKTASPDLTAFDESDMWAVVDGIPVFKCFVITALATNTQGEEVTEITETGVYTVSVVDGDDNPLTTQLEVDSANVTISGTTVTVGEGYYTATLTVKDGEGNVIRTYPISVDTRVPEENNEEIIATKKGAIIVKGTALQGLEISSVKYNGNEIYTPGETVTNFADSGAINTADFVYGDDGISLTGNLVVTTNTKIYELTNVNVYADAYENTTASRERMVLEFSNNATAKAREAGYYILLENLVFDTTNPLEVFANTEADCRVFNDTFDGRGYAMTDTMINNTGYSIFGDWGENAVIKNVAFNNFYLAKLYGTSSITTLTRQATRGLLFYDAETTESELTLDNVYVYVEYEIGASYSSTIAFGTENTGSITSNNLFIHIVDKTTNGTIGVGTYHSTVYTATVSRTATNSYVVNPAAKDNGPLGTLYKSVDEMKTASPNLTVFEDSDMWAVVDGIPVWNSLQA